MTDGAAPPSPPPNGGGGGAGIWAWMRPVSIGLLLAVVLLVLLAGLLNDLLPGTGGGVISGPTTSPTPSVSVPPTTAPTTQPTTEPTQSGDGGATATGGGGENTAGGGNNNGGGSNNNGGGSNGGGSNRTDPPVSTPSRSGLPPTPTQTPPTPLPPPTVGPMQCTVYSPPGYCNVRQLLSLTVRTGRVTLTNSLGGPQLGANATLVKLSPGNSVGSPSVGGRISPLVLTDTRGGGEGWTVTANIAWPGGVPDGVVVSVDPTCAIGDLDAAPGLHAGPAAQSLGQSVTMCKKDGQVGAGGSTGGVYVIGGQVSVSTWIGTPIPATGVLVTFSVN